ncbi:MAG: lysophospholipid acyltransferase family protein [Terracidiphilus sp.]|jgi:1-acyl-sn-glycerol-3-phosphate acyltransferase
MSFRAFRRAVALGLALALVVLRYWLLRLHGSPTMERRAQWMQTSCRGILTALGITYRVEGLPPSHGLVVSNHLSYLDILILSAAMPCFFVAKMEIDGWPYFGKAARVGGTIFLDRSSLASATTVAEQMSERLKLAVPVLLFPEGTSTDGSQVLRFHSRLIDPATAAGIEITAAAVHYVIEDGTPEQALCWYGDTEFLPHLIKTLEAPGFLARVRFGRARVYPDRRTAADQTHAEITSMRLQLSLP